MLPTGFQLLVVKISVIGSWLTTARQLSKNQRWVGSGGRSFNPFLWRRYSKRTSKNECVRGVNRTIIGYEVKIIDRKVFLDRPKTENEIRTISKGSPSTSDDEICVNRSTSVWLTRNISTSNSDSGGFPEGLTSDSPSRIIKFSVKEDCYCLKRRSNLYLCTSLLSKVHP